MTPVQVGNRSRLVKKYHDIELIRHYPEEIYLDLEPRKRNLEKKATVLVSKFNRNLAQITQVGPIYREAKAFEAEMKQALKASVLSQENQNTRNNQIQSFTMKSIEAEIETELVPQEEVQEV